MARIMGGDSQNHSTRTEHPGQVLEIPAYWDHWEMSGALRSGQGYFDLLCSLYSLSRLTKIQTSLKTLRIKHPCPSAIQGKSSFLPQQISFHS